MRSTGSLLLAILVLMCGSGVMGSLIALRLEDAGVAAPMIGFIASFYFLGLLAGSLQVPGLIRRIGHIRAFAAVVSLLAASTLIYPLWRNEELWMALRLINGFCLAGVYVCIESWLNSQADARTRGTVLAAYMIALYIGQSASQFLLNLTTNPLLPFIAASIMMSLAALPVALTRMEAPALTDHGRLGPRELYAASPLGAVGVGMTGLMLAAFYALGAVYARRQGASVSTIALFMTSSMAGGVALQYPLGRLSDAIDRRLVIILSLAGTVVVAGALAFAQPDRIALLALGAAFGGLAYALYPLCVAHTNDRLATEQRVAASGGLVMVYSAGSLAGPLLGSAAMSAIGPGGLFAFIALCALSTLAFAVWRQLASAPVPGEEQQRWLILPRTSPVAAQLDPIAPDVSDR